MKKPITPALVALTFVLAAIFSFQSPAFSSDNTNVTEVPLLDWPIEIVSEGHGFTEGAAIGPGGSVYFSDLDNGYILKFDPGSGETSVWNEKSNFSNGLFIVDHWMYACEATGRCVVRYDLNKGPNSRKVIVDRFDGKKLGSPNDLAVFGNQLAFSSFFWKKKLPEDDNERQIFENRSYVANLDSDEVLAVPHKFQTPNGVLYDPKNEYLYLGEMKNSEIYRTKVTKGKLGPVELFFDLKTINKGKPDGMSVDPDGRLYVALFGMSDQLLILSPDAKPIGVLPTGHRTSNCTVTADGKTIYITADLKLKRVQIPPLGRNL